jgi:hypothetical protein
MFNNKLEGWVVVDRDADNEVIKGPFISYYLASASLYDLLLSSGCPKGTCGD